MNLLRILPLINFAENHMQRAQSNVVDFPGRHRNLPDQSWIDVHQQWGSHWPDRMLAGLDQLMGALSSLLISTDKTTYKVGESPTYRISGGVPLGHVAWTSFRNGQPTGEFQADYPGDDLNESGALTVRAGAWSASDVGDWVKEILIVPPGYAQNPDYGALHIARVEFSVVPMSTQVGTSGQASATPQQSQAGGIFDSKINLPLVGNVPVIAVAGIAGLGLLLVMGSGGKR